MLNSKLDTGLIIVGKLIGIYGIKGWLKLISYTEPVENILAYGPWLLEAQGEFREIKTIERKKHGKGFIVHVLGFDNPETARTLVGAEIAIARKQLPTLPAGEYYWADLVGLTVINQANITLGNVIEVIATGANDVLIIQGKKRHLVPFLKPQTILSIDMQKQSILVDWNADF